MESKKTKWLPHSQRDFIFLFVGAGVALGMTQIPGITIEPSSCTQCRLDLSTCTVSRDKIRSDLIEIKDDMQGRLTTCWETYRDLKVSQSD